MNLKTRLTLMLILLLNVSLFAQDGYTLTGTVIDNTNMPVPGANVVIENTTTGTSTDFDGNFTINVSAFPTVLVISSIGFTTQELNVDSAQSINIALLDGVALDEIVITGNRSKPRTILNSPVPIDNFGVEELRNTGQPTVDKMLTYKMPSFNSTNQTISDGNTLTFVGDVGITTEGLNTDQITINLALERLI